MGRTKRLDETAIVEFLLTNPTATSEDAGKRFGCLDVTIRAIAKKNDIVCERTLMNINHWHRKTPKEK